MKKLKKIKIKVNGKIKTINDETSLNELINALKIPISKVAIEFNGEESDYATYARELQEYRSVRTICVHSR